MSKYFEEYRIGEKFITSARTVTETDVITFACSTGDMHPNHTDAEYMSKSQFGKRIAHGLMGIAWAHGLMYRLDLLTESAIALICVEDWKMVAPIFIGDTIHAEITVKELIPSRSKPDRGVMKMYFELINQDGLVCQTGIKALMMKRKAK